MAFRQQLSLIEYDPNRTANIALICYADGEKAYILAPEGLKVGHDSYERTRKLKSELVTAYRFRTYPGWYYGSQH